MRNTFIFRIINTTGVTGIGQSKMIKGRIKEIQNILTTLKSYRYDLHEKKMPHRNAAFVKNLKWFCNPQRKRVVHEHGEMFTKLYPG